MSFRAGPIATGTARDVSRGCGLMARGRGTREGADGGVSRHTWMVAARASQGVENDETDSGALSATTGMNHCFVSKSCPSSLPAPCRILIVLLLISLDSIGLTVMEVSEPLQHLCDEGVQSWAALDSRPMAES